MLGNKSIRKNEVITSIDWIAFTSTLISSAVEMFQFLGYSEADFHLLPKGANGYSKMYRLKSFPVSVLSDGNEDMGVHVVISGSAIQDVLQHYQRTISEATPFGGNAVHFTDFDNTIMIEFLQDIKRIGWLTRFDLAVDDLGGQFFTVEDVRNFLDQREVVSKFRTFRDVYESSLSCECTGHTIYLGSRQSEVMLRIYDKMLEQNKKAEKEEDKIQEPWIRWELELKNERANIAADFLIQQKELGEIVVGILNNYVRIIIPDDSNRTRCSVHPLWEKFLGTIAKLRLFVMESGKTINEKRQWIIRTVLPTLAGIIIADMGSFDIITQHFDDAVQRMSPYMQQLVTQVNPGWINDFDSFFI